MTQPSPEIVDRVVREVLAALRSAHSQAASNGAGVVFSGRLLTERHAEQFAANQGAISLAPGTVITPLARDLLKRRGIAVRFLHRSRTEKPGEWGFRILWSSGMGEALRRSLLDGAEVWVDLHDLDPAGWVAESPVRGAAVVTEEAALEVYRASRRPGVRAAAAHDAAAADRAVRQIGANLLAIEPFGQTLHSLRQILANYRRCGAPVAPEGRSPGGAASHEDRRGDRSGDIGPGPSRPATPPPVDRPAHAPGRLDGRLAGSWGGGHRF